MKKFAIALALIVMSSLSSAQNLIKIDKNSRGVTAYAVQGSHKAFINKHKVPVVMMSIVWSDDMNTIIPVAIPLASCETNGGQLQMGPDNDYVMYGWARGGPKMYDTFGAFLCDVHAAAQSERRPPASPPAKNGFEKAVPQQSRSDA